MRGLAAPRRRRRRRHGAAGVAERAGLRAAAPPLRRLLPLCRLLTVGRLPDPGPLFAKPDARHRVGPGIGYRVSGGVLSPQE